jgi:Uncharacterized membrane-associated protein
MQDLIIEIMNKFGYVGISLLIAIENLFPPIPSEVILTFGGVMTTQPKSHISVIGVIIAATIGSVIGAIILFGVGRLLSVERLGKILDGKIGKLLHFRKEDVFKACEWFNKHGKKTVLLCRCVPVVRSLISIPAGMANMQFGIFLALTALGSLVWNTVLVNLGVLAGNSWEKIVAGVGVYQTITLVVLGVIAILILALYVRYRKKESKISDK